MKIKRNLPPEKRSWWKRTPEEPVTTKRVEVPWLRLKRRRPERGWALSFYKLIVLETISRC